MDVYWWEHILNCSCVLEWMNKKKPFGDQFPIEVQSRIMCMVWEKEHQEKWKHVMSELVRIEVCELSEWCCYKSPNRGFIIPMHERQFLWNPGNHQNMVEKQQCNDVCRWCTLYYGKRCALEVEIAERILTRKRQQLMIIPGDPDEPCISNAAWKAFVRDHIQWYHDVYQFSLCQIMIPFLVYMAPAQVQFSHKRVPKVVTSFHIISTGAEMAYDNFQNRANRYTLFHPSYLLAKFREGQRQRQEMKVLSQRISDKMKEQSMKTDMASVFK